MPHLQPWATSFLPLHQSPSTATMPIRLTRLNPLLPLSPHLRYRREDQSQELQAAQTARSHSMRSSTDFSPPPFPLLNHSLHPLLLSSSSSSSSRRRRCHTYSNMSTFQFTPIMPFLHHHLHLHLVLSTLRKPKRPRPIFSIRSSPPSPLRQPHRLHLFRLLWSLVIPLLQEEEKVKVKEEELEGLVGFIPLSQRICNLIRDRPINL